MSRCERAKRQRQADEENPQLLDGEGASGRDQHGRQGRYWPGSRYGGPDRWLGSNLQLLTARQRQEDQFLRW